MKAEEYFFRYAFPCSETLMQLKRISEEDYEALKEMFFSRKYPDKKTIERLFPVSLGRIRILADEISDDVWGIETIKEYWQRYHNSC